MPAPRSADPLVHVPLRLPLSVVQDLRAKAVRAGVTLADTVRQHLTLSEAKPLGMPVPRRRAKSLGEVSESDPVLLRSIAGIGNNVNQLARAVHVGELTGDLITALHVLVELRAIEQQLDRLGRKD